MDTITIILGCTGCGKGAVGREVARRVGAEIVSVDSMKVYRGMDIGTAKPDAAARGGIPHHLMDVADPWETFSVARYVELAEAAGDRIVGRGRNVLAVGGTALYIKALCEGLFEGPGSDAAIRRRLRAQASTEGNTVLHDRLREVDPVSADRIHVNDLRRIVRALEVYELTGRPISALQTQWDAPAPRRAYRLIGLRRALTDQNHRTNERVRRMVRRGLVDEVERLVALDRPLSQTARQAVGYAEIIEYLSGETTLDEAIERIKINTRRLAKSQRTWFKRFRDVAWIDMEPDASVASVTDRIERLM